jgi:molecular chaperone DnaK
MQGPNARPPLAIGPICGIDLGTTFSSIAFLNAFGRAEVVPAPDGSRSIPSVVLFPPEVGIPIVGRGAKERSAEHPSRVVEFVKREMGDPDWRFDLDGDSYTPEAISAIILRHLVDLAAARLGERPKQAVITCPAYFGDLERQATADAGRLAGIEVLSVFNEPTAAALAFGLHQAATDRPMKALVYDLGGGTFDVTLLELHGRRVHVLATAGEHRLGGKDWDDELLNRVAERFEAEHKQDPREDLVAQQDLRNRCEAAKVALSTKLKATIFCRAYGKTTKFELTRTEFETLTRPLLLQTKSYVDQVLQTARVPWGLVDVVLPVGGSSYMPQVRELLRTASGREPEVLIDPELAVVQGATYYAALHLAKQGFEIQVFGVAQPSGRKDPTSPTDSAPQVDTDLPCLPPVSMEEAPELLMLPGQSGDDALLGAQTDAMLPGAVGPAPEAARPVFARPSMPGTPVSKAAPRPLGQSSAEFDPMGWPIDPTRTVVYDFADMMAITDQRLVQSMELAPEEKKKRLDDVVRNVNARPLGVLVYSQGRAKTSVMIKANSQLPALHLGKFFTANDNQTAVKVVVLEGEAEDPASNARIGECVISGLPARKKGQEIEIVYIYDLDGRIVIRARDVGSGMEAEVELKRTTAWSPEEQA